MKKFLFIIIAALMFISCNSMPGEKVTEEKKTKDTVIETVVVKPEVLNELVFRQKVFDYEKGKKWKYLGTQPCIIDFYADWCAPCRKLAPILDELAIEYKGQIQFYKLNTDQNQNVSGYFKVNSIPAVLLCPMEGEPQMIVGLYPKQDYINAINQVLLSTAASQK